MILVYELACDAERGVADCRPNDSSSRCGQGPPDATMSPQQTRALGTGSASQKGLP
jgi:hypothetical protein